MTTVYLTDEALNALNERKKKGDFNMSSFVSSILLRNTGDDGQTIDICEQEINKRKAQIQLLESEIEDYILRIKKIKEESTKYKNEKEEELRDAEERTEIMYYIGSWTDEKDKEYRQGLKDKKWNGTVEYGRYKIRESKAKDDPTP